MQHTRSKLGAGRAVNQIVSAALPQAPVATPSSPNVPSQPTATLPLPPEGLPWAVAAPVAPAPKAKPPATPSSLAQPSPKPTPAPQVTAPKAAAPSLEPETAEAVFTLAGVTFSKYPFETLSKGQPVYLVADPYGAVVKPDKGHPDPHAVSCQDEQNRHIGYLQKEYAQLLTNFWKQHPQMTYKAVVQELKGGYDGLSWGVDVYAVFSVPSQVAA